MPADTDANEYYTEKIFTEEKGFSVNASNYEGLIIIIASSNIGRGLPVPNKSGGKTFFA